MSATTSNEFYARFRSAVSSVSALQNPDLRQISDLRLQLTQATEQGILNAHDRSVLETLLRDLSKPPKPSAFAFRRNRNAGSEVSAALGVSGGSEVLEVQTELPSVAGPADRNAGRIEPPDTSALTIKGLESESYVAPVSTEPVSINVTSIKNTLIDLRSLQIKSVQLRSISRSIILLPPVKGSIMAHFLTESFISVPHCGQFRAHESHRCTVRLNTESRVTIEWCSKMRFCGDVRVQDFDLGVTNYEVWDQRDGEEEGVQLDELEGLLPT